MVVQFFVTVGFISSYLGQIVIVGLLLRYPMERILKYEWQFVGLAFVFKSLTGVCKNLVCLVHKVWEIKIATCLEGCSSASRHRSLILKGSAEL